MKWEGLDELRAALRALPEALAIEAGGIVLAAAEQAKAELVAAYPEIGTGNLRRGVYVRASNAGRFGAGAILVSKANHAWLYEHGSQTRRNLSGANRGSMPAQPTFGPIVARRRRAMYADLKALLERHGLQVRDDAAA